MLCFWRFRIASFHWEILRFLISDLKSENFWYFFTNKTEGIQYCLIGIVKTSSGPEFRVVWLWETLASGWGSLWESSSFVPCFVPSLFRDVSRKVPEWPWTNEFRRKSSRQDRAPKIQGELLWYSNINFFRILSYIVLWYSNMRVLCHVTPKMFRTILLVKGCKLSFISQS